MVIYSHSKLSTFQQCKLKFKFQYIDKLIPETEHTIESFLGKCVHDTLEWIYNNEKRAELSMDLVLEYYSNIWNKNYKSDIKLVKTENNVGHYYNNGIKFLIDYFLKHRPFEDNTIATEKKILVDLDEKGDYKLQGYIDRLVHDTKTNKFQIHDYKTGQIKSQEEIDNDRQLALYALGIYKEYPNANEVELVWHFLAFNKQISSSRTINQLNELKKEVRKLIDEIESTKEFNPTPTLLCKWCAFRKYCPLFNGHKNLINKSLNTFI